VTIKQYGVLTGQYEKTVSGSFSVSSNVLTITPYESWVLNKYYVVTVKKGLSSTGAAKDLASNYTFSFTSLLHPMYSSYILVRQTGGAFLDLIPQDVINREIHYFSLLVDAIAPGASSSGYWYVTQYVTCRTAYSLLTGAMQKLVISGYRSKTLGDFTIETNTDVKNSVGPKLDQLKACIEETTNLLLNDGLRYPEALTGIRSEAELTSALTDLTRHPAVTGRELTDEEIYEDQYTEEGPLKTLY